MSTLKKDIIKMFAFAPKTEALAKNQVIFLTAAGFIVGDLPDAESNDPGAALISALVNKAGSQYADTDLEGNDGCIQLTNARLLPTNGNPCNLGDIVLFPDQIVGVKLGTIE